MELRQLRQFVMLAEHGNFRIAAERLHMAQPPLSVAIRKLEEELGQILFIRGSRGVRLTMAGEAALKAAQACLDAAATVRTAAEEAVAGLSGTLRIGFGGSVAVRILPRVVQLFGQRYPGVRLELREGANAELLALAEGQSLDAVFVRLPTSRPPELRFQLVEDDVFCLALPRGHALAKKSAVALSSLEGLPFIGYAPSLVGGLNAAVSRVLQRGNVAPRITQEAIQVQTALGLVASGLGIAMVPAANTPFQRLHGVVFRPIADLPADAHIGIALAYHSLSEKPALERFLEVTAEAI